MRIHRDDAVALPQLQDRLTAAAGRVGAERASRRTRRRAPRLLVAAVACLAFGGTAMAATGWNPPIGTDAYSGPASTSDTPVPEEFTDVLGVLRRPPTEQDRSAAVEATLRNASFPTDGVRAESVRYLGPGADGEAAILYSAEKGKELPGSFGGLYDHVPLGEPVCIAQPSERRGRGFEAGELKRDPDLEALLTEPISICFEINQLLAGQVLAMIEGPEKESMLAFGMVPDGVATVTVEFGSTHGPTIPVLNNYFASSIGAPELPPYAGEIRTVWRDAEGNVVPQRPEPAG